MGSFKRDKKEEEDGNGNPYQSLEKTSVLQETRAFNETPVNARRCTHILTKILYLINQGETLLQREATDTFFAMTKLFQSKDVVMRRMVYLGIKELSALSDDVIIVTSSLTKDMTGKEDLYRAAAIRALCSITDNTMLQAVERYMKQCIVDKNAAVSCAALVSSLHLANTSGEVVKRWANEAQEALNSDNIMVQYHALGLLYHIRKADRLAVSKLVNKLTRQNLKSPYAVCLLIRIACRLIEDEDVTGNAENPLFAYIETCLRHKSEMVVYEAAHAIVNLKRTTARELAPAISILQLFCGSPKVTLRFAAVRTMNKVAMIHPAAITTCNLDLESLITDSNRSVATLAITTLLKTGAESSVERLMKQIATFVADITDEFKVVIVQAIRALCTKFPRKHVVLTSFLSQMLREEGGLNYKASIVDSMITIIEENPEAKEAGLAHLCEFIEDCEHTTLAVRILHLLGKEGPYSVNPSKYIRFIYNRVILENAYVRAAAVSAIAQFGAACPNLLPNILVLLSRCQMDTDDEVRDRATYFANILRTDDAELRKNYITERPKISFGLLERSLAEHIADGAKSGHPSIFDLRTLPTLQATANDDHSNKNRVDDLIMSGVPSATKVPKISREEQNAERLAQIAKNTALGTLHKSSAALQLTESETEYTVQLIKHIYARYIVFQFDCVNTLADQLLENVHVELLMPDAGYAGYSSIAHPRLAYNDPTAGSCYLIVEFDDDAKLNTSINSFGATLKFLVKDCDPSTGLPDSDEGYNDEYTLEDIDVTVADMMQRNKINNFAQIWDESTAEEWHEFEDTFALGSAESIQNAVNTIIKYLGVAPCNATEKVPDGARIHTLIASGIFRTGHPVLVQCKIALGDGVMLLLTVRSPSSEVAELVATAIEA